MNLVNDGVIEGSVNLPVPASLECGNHHVKLLNNPTYQQTAEFRMVYC